MDGRFPVVSVGHIVIGVVVVGTTVVSRCAARIVTTVGYSGTRLLLVAGQRCGTSAEPVCHWIVLQQFAQHVRDRIVDLLAGDALRQLCMMMQIIVG
uniref:Putative secreted peptide n=1 Tax=Anopheles braziliensis TaxID=58242 RepID=A0A2M3ZS16_9DIPT